MIVLDHTVGLISMTVFTLVQTSRRDSELGSIRVLPTVYRNLVAISVFLNNLMDGFRPESHTRQAHMSIIRSTWYINTSVPKKAGTFTCETRVADARCTRRYYKETQSSFSA